MQGILRDLAPLEKQGKVEGFFKNAENAAQLGGLVEGIRDVLMEYQTSLQQGIYGKQQDIYDEQQGINDKSRLIMVNLVPSSFTSRAN